MAATLHFASRAAAVVPGPLDEALWYARALGWRVCPGGTAEPPEGATDPAVLAAWWAACPEAPVRLATGAAFDVLDVPGAAGTRALRRAEQLGLPLGPVAATAPRNSAGGRVQFFVAPGVADDLPGLLDWLDWSGLGLDLRAYGTGDSIPAPSPWPATWLAPWPRAWESARWLRAPAASRLRCAAGTDQEALMRVDVRFPDVTRLLSGLADACQHVRLLPRPRHAG
ncbi:bifunctional DNA primase/polymerase [Yinghuangia seranimata]|uniref:bifunctional DNA primase/polymerase n=1 Tax=Yinghuangia seranimata TaxID=408067 RepID=UPI00248A9A55|nr:bifunctional DNA primase/polymerase [Yinghuangia seranimata]MDI2132956.1 bifunctional DNA primase/polymerase [Yinghuangia seranimata]